MSIPTLTALAGLVEALERLHAKSKSPMKSWETGEVVDAQAVEEITEDALAAWRTRLPMAANDYVVEEVSRIVYDHTGIGVSQLAAVTFGVLRVLDARMGKP